MTSKALELGKLAGYVQVDTANDVVEVLGAEVVLPDTGVTAGTYGNTTAIPVVTVDAAGRLTNVTTSSVSGVTGLSYSSGNNTLTVLTSTTGFTANIQAGLTQAYSNATSYSDTRSAAAYANAVAYANTAAATAYSNATAYTDTQAALKASLTGATFTGPVVVSNTANLGNTTTTNIRATGSVQIDGDLVVSGNTISVSSSTMSITDNMVYMNNGTSANVAGITGNGTHIVVQANNNFAVGWDVTIYGVTPSSFNATYQNITAANATHFVANSTVTDTYVSGGTARGKTDANPDVGFAAGYNDGTYHHTGFFRDASDGVWKVFDNYQPEPDDDVYINTSHATFHIADLQANVVHGVSFTGNANTSTTANNSLYLGGQDGTYYAGLSTSAYTNAVSYANTTFAPLAGATFTGAVTVNNSLSVTGVIAASANAAVNGRLLVGNSAATPMRTLTVYGGDISLIGTNNTSPTATLYVTNRDGDYGSNATLLIQGWDLSASIPTALANVTISSNTTNFAGSIKAAGDIYSSYSDARLKTKISDIDDPIGKIKQIDTMIYEPNELALSLGIASGRKVGVSAQSVINVQPEAVGTSAVDPEYLTVQYERLVPLLIAAVKKQQEVIEELTKKLGEQ